jgi:hypothetical protein
MHKTRWKFKSELDTTELTSSSDLCLGSDPLCHMQEFAFLPVLPLPMPWSDEMEL